MILVVEEASGLLAGIKAIVAALQTSGILAVRTSGTTGTPKEITLDLRQAMERKRAGDAGERWLLTYGAERWAGISVVLHALKSGCELCVPRSLEFADLIEAMRRLKPTHLSFTPSMFRNLVRVDTSGALAACPVIQVTFGGEASPQAVLNLAAHIWPNARVSQVYAATETGDICAVSDGLEGVPRSKFAPHTLTAEGELKVQGHLTGDLWELRGERYYFKGRKEEIINVGGNKVSPLVVEEFAITQGASTARAYATPSPLMGSLVTLDYVDGPDEQTLALAFRKVFPKYACPARLSKVDGIPLSPAGKNQRIL